MEEEHTLANPKFVFQHVWNYVLISEMLKSLAKDTDKLYESPGDPLRSNLHDYYLSNLSILDLDFGTRVVSVLNGATDHSTLESLGDGESVADEAIKSLRDYQIARRLKEFAEREGITFFVVADDLDKHWRPNNSQSIELLVSLMAEADRQQRFFQGRLNVVMFLREDIYDVLAQYDEDLPKRSFLRMEWTRTNLKHLVAERLSTAADQSNDDDDATWSDIFGEKVSGMPASDYILSRALPRPRDVLDFCQKSIDQAQRNGHGIVTEQDILDGETSFSESLFWSVAAEIQRIVSEP